MDVNGSDSINKVEKNNHIGPNQVLATGKSSRIEIKQKDMFWRIGSLSVAKWNLDNEFFGSIQEALYFALQVKQRLNFQQASVGGYL